MIRVLVSDDHPVVRAGVAAILRDDPAISVVGIAASGEQALAEAERVRPHVAVLDIRLSGMSGVEACRQLRNRCPNVRSVMVTATFSKLDIRECMKAGAYGFVPKIAGPRALIEAIHAAAGGERYVEPELLKTYAGSGRAREAFGLTRQKSRIVEHLPSGRTNRQIGEQLGITEATVKTHLSHAMKKLGIKTRAAVAALAERGGLL